MAKLYSVLSFVFYFGCATYYCSKHLIDILDLILTTTLQDKNYYYLPITHEQTEIWRREFPQKLGSEGSKGSHY